MSNLIEKGTGVRKGMFYVHICVRDMCKCILNVHTRLFGMYACISNVQKVSLRIDD